jgi:Na+/H+ antiporter NhaD/arsenite permease-like protein
MLGAMNPWVTLSIVSITYIGIAIGYFPKLQTNRTTIALIGVGLLLLTRQINFDDIGAFLDLDTIVLLFSMMIINANLRLAGFFGLAGNALLRLTRNPRGFLALEILLMGVLSALFLNDTICLMFTPFLLDLTLAIGRNPIPYLIALATSANIGSVATLTGNPQNMIIGIASGISYLDFAATLTPIAILCLGIIWVVIILFYPGEFNRTNSFAIAPTTRVRYYPWLMYKTLAVIASLLIAFMAGVPIALASFIAASVLLITRQVRPDKVFSEIDWNLLVFFAGLFIVTGALEATGLTGQLLDATNLAGKFNAWSFSAVAVILSNLVSNVPAVLLLKPVTASLADPRAGWLTLAAASTLAGNLTLLGSVANLIVAEIAGRRKVLLSFWEYTKAGALITLITVLISTTWLALLIW